jgi:hypothetical protein
MSRRPDPLAQVSDFDIRLLRIFRAVVECGGFSAAENVLGIGRSAISQQMSDLEQRLGLRLWVPWRVSAPKSTGCTAICVASSTLA